MSDALVTYEAADGIAILTLTDPPANTYSYEMMRALDEAVLKARMDDAVHVLVLRGAGRQVLLRRRQHQDAGQRHAAVQVLLLPARQRDARPAWSRRRSS